MCLSFPTKFWHITFFIFFFIALTSPLTLNHNLWYEKWKEEASNPSKSVFESKHWNFCDLKCFYLENYFSYDFVVIKFTEHAYRPDFNACYIRNQDSNQAYTIWFKKINNRFYESACGMDMEDYLQAPDQYKVVQISGQGKEF